MHTLEEMITRGDFIHIFRFIKTSDFEVFT